jgi:uncharacterized membrane protein YoaK (UPF0700 family)
MRQRVVTIGAALILGTSGVIAKVLTLPVFCMMIIAVRLVSFYLSQCWTALETMLTLKLLLLLVAAVLAMRIGPFANGDSAPAIIMGMTLVSAIAIQNAAQRIHVGAAPPTTIMTGTTTQIMIDVADIIRGPQGVAREVIQARLRRMCATVASFAAGALLFHAIGSWCFALPPVVALLARITVKSSLTARTNTPGPRSPTTVAN